MIRHIVMYKLNEPSAENKKVLTERFMSMKGKIPCLLNIEAGVDILNSERSYDVCLICTFENMEKLTEYRGHPVHIPVMQYVKSIVKESHSVDFKI